MILHLETLEAKTLATLLRLYTGSFLIPVAKYLPITPKFRGLVTF